MNKNSFKAPKCTNALPERTILFVRSRLSHTTFEAIGAENLASICGIVWGIECHRGHQAVDVLLVPWTTLSTM